MSSHVTENTQGHRGSRLLNDVRLDTARAEPPLRVAALEIHSPPDSWMKSRRRRARRHAGSSFTRAKNPEKGDPTGTKGARHWRRQHEEAATYCRFIGRFIAAQPQLLRELRAVGLMHWERNGPVWLYEAPFRRLIEASRKVAAAHPRRRLQPLHTAFHLGRISTTCSPESGRFMSRSSGT